MSHRKDRGDYLSEWKSAVDSSPARGDPVSTPERALPVRNELTVVDNLVLRAMLRRQAAILEELEPLDHLKVDDRSPMNTSPTKIVDNAIIELRLE